MAKSGGNYGRKLLFLFVALILPPLSLHLIEERRQFICNLCLYVTSIVTFWLFFAGPGSILFGMATVHAIFVVTRKA